MEFKFNSKDREQVDIGFRLGGYGEDIKGQAWFSNFTLEEGYQETNTNWNFVCFIFDSVDVTVQDKGQEHHVQLQMKPEDIYDMKENMQRFKNAVSSLSNNSMTAEYDIIEIQEPITTLSYDEENGYYVGAKDVDKLIKEYMYQKDYDHIFVCVRMGDINEQNTIPVHDWIGLGAMDYYGIGFSNIRLPNSSNNYIYKYDPHINTFPEEVFVHEFLHSLERTLKEYNKEIPALHDNLKYGYQEERLNRIEEMV